MSPDNESSVEVQMERMRPAQLEQALRRFPVVFVPFGLIEWHGRHLPLGTDALKAHGILVRSAQQFGGAVYPPIYFPHAQPADRDELHEDDRHNFKIPLLTSLFRRLRRMGVRVIVAVSGHDIPQQVAWFNAALQPVIADGTMAGVALLEITLTESLPDAGTDHAAKWETADMMFLHPELVNMEQLGTGPLAPNQEPPDGIEGLDPRIHASAEVGRRNVELAAAAIGARARELLESLPAEHREFGLPAIAPEHWWWI